MLRVGVYSAVTGAEYWGKHQVWSLTVRAVIACVLGTLYSPNAKSPPMMSVSVLSVYPNN